MPHILKRHAFKCYLTKQKTAFFTTCKIRHKHKPSTFVCHLRIPFPLKTNTQASSTNVVLWPGSLEEGDLWSLDFPLACPQEATCCVSRASPERACTRNSFWTQVRGADLRPSETETLSANQPHLTVLPGFQEHVRLRDQQPCRCTGLRVPILRPRPLLGIGLTSFSAFSLGPNC